ncbi:MAG TPA: oligopeptide:H+ symporter [Flavobacteriaceae bacterium]|nr:oligopeptide:H+ symporter [Flavobacteriaceae bacterium]
MATDTHANEFLGHPKGLFVLFFTEMWERFSYYGMRGILTLYLVASTAAADPGMGWSTRDALWLYGWYTMLVYVASIPGGWVADKFLGQKRTVMIGGGLLVLGHGILAVPQDWAFFTGLALIILGVGGLKPNISTMVGGLYPPGDIRRDSGFTIFYIGINIGALLASISVGLVAYYYGWHYGFGLAGIGMLLGQLVFIWGQKFLVGVGEFTGGDKVTPEQRAAAQRPLTKIEKDRVIVLLLSFLIIIVFWGAFEQAGGLLNLYTDTKIDRYIGLSWLEEIPAAVFQGLNSAYIILFGTAVGAFWVWWQKSGRESSSLFKMAIGTIIMGLGYVFMIFASQEASAETFGKAAMYWIFLAYLFHTIGELSASPVALSFITKLSPLKYSSIMMGLFFAATGFGDKLAGSIGSMSQLVPYNMEVQYDKAQLTNLMTKDSIRTKDENNKIITVYDYPINIDLAFEVKTKVYLDEGEVLFKEYDTDKDISDAFKLDAASYTDLKSTLEENKVTQMEPYHARIIFEKDDDARAILENKGDGEDYYASFVLEEVQSRMEHRTFTGLVIFTVAFGLLLLVFLKRLKRLTYGAEDMEVEGV